MAYNKHEWSTGEAITAAKMNDIENGIAAVSNNTDANTTSITTINTNIDTISDKIGLDNFSTSGNNTVSGKITAIINSINTINSTIGENYFGTSEPNNIAGKIKNMYTTIEQDSAQGRLAWTELLGAGVTEDPSNAGVVTTTLKQVLDQYTLYSDIIAAYRTPNASHTIIKNGEPVTVASLADRIKHIYNELSEIDTLDASLTELTGRVSRVEDNIGSEGLGANARLTALDGGNINSEADLPKRNIKQLIEEIGNAHFTNSNIYSTNNGGSIDYGSLVARFNADESKIKNVETEINAAHRNGLLDDNDQAIADTLDLRFDHIDGGVKPIRTLPNVITEINGAHRDANDTLDARLDDIDDTTNANSIVSQVNTLKTSKIGTDKIFNDLTRAANIEGYVLDARQGKVLNDMIGTGFDSTNTVAARIDAIDNGSTGTVHGLDTRITALETEVDMTSANSRIDNVETEVTNARTSHIVQYDDNGTMTDTTYASLDARLEAIEEHAAASRTDIDTIAGELGMTDTNGLKTLGTRVDDLDNHVTLLATELGMVSNGEIMDVTSRVDTLETEVGNAHRQNGDTLDSRFDDIENTISHTHDENDPTDLLPDGLTQRLTVVETSITGNGGINARLDAIDDASTGAIKTLQDSDTALDIRLDAIDGGSVLSTVNGTLGARVTTLEGKDTIIVGYDGEHSNYTTVSDEQVPNYATPSADADYLIADDDGKYFYWRYINNSWKLISGAGGGGTGSSSGEFAASLASINNPNENIDYFVGNDNDGYIHYRYIPSQNQNETGAFVQILPKNLINSLGVASINVTTADATDQLPAAVSQMSGGILAYAIGDTGHSTNLLNNFTALRYVRLKTTYEEDGITLKKQELIFTDTTGQDMAPIEIKGGGGGSTDYNIRLLDMSGATSFMAPASEDAVTTVTLKPIVNYGNTIAEGVSINVTVQYKLSTESESEYKNASITIPAISNNNSFTLNVSSLLGSANTTTDIKVTASTQPDGDQGSIYTKSVTYHVTTVTMTIESVGFDQAAIRTGSSFDFGYKCTGYDLSKTMTFIIDNSTPITEDIGKSHNEERSKTITLTGLQDGMHTLQAYYTVGAAKSNILNYYFIYNSDATRTAPIVAVAGANASIHYGDDLTINYTVYTPGQERTDEVDIEVYRLDGANEINVGSFSQANVLNSTVIPFTIPEYPLNESQYTIYVRVTARKNSTPVLSDTATAAIIIIPANFDYQLKYADPDNRNLLFMYNVAGKSNNDVNKEVYKYRFTPKDGNDPFDFTATFNNFNWATNGYITDKTTGENALVISGGANCAINVPVFNRTFSYTPEGESEAISVSIESDSSNASINTRGRTVELDYEVVSTVDANSTIIECMGANGAGIKVTPQSCYLVNSTTPANISQDSSGFINNESSISAAYLSTGQRIHLVFVIEPEATVESTVGGFHQCVNIYVNGEFANSQPYTKGTVFSSDATMTIGNATSLIKLYGIRMYNRGFSDKEVLQNYMMAPSKINDKLARFEANNVLDNETGLVSYSKAMKKYNCLLLTGVMSPYKGSPSTIRFDGVDSQGNPVPVGKRESALVLTKPNTQVQSGYVTEFELYDKLNDGGYASSNNVQGTSSQKYPIHNLKVYLAKGDDTDQQVFDTNTNISVKKIYKYSVNTAALAAYNSVYSNAASTPDYIKNCANEVSTIIKNLAVVPTQAEVVEKIEEYLAAEDSDVSAAYSTYSTGDELITHPTLTYKKAKKVKYQLNGANSIGESTLCWKADYMSTDHANTYNANMANGLFTYKLPSQDPDQGGDSKVQNTVKGIRCLLFVRADESSAPVFIGDGCLNNDKGNNKTFGLEHSSDDGNDTLRQKWEFTNNSEGLCLFKSDHLYEMITTGEGANQKTEMRAKGGFESTYPDEGDLEDEGLEPNYTHLQILLTWVYQRANFWDASSEVVSGVTYTYNGQTYNNEQAYRKAIFLNEFNRHFVLNHVLTYYLFSEFIALCDNRAKNMFLRCDNVRSEQIKLASDNTQLILDGNEFGDDGTLWNQLVTPNTGVVDASMIDWETSTFAVWAPVLYDLDSCYGVENVGYLTIPYDADWYYNLKGWNKSQISKAQIDNPNEDQISFQFSGVASRLWLMVEEVYGSNIQELAKTLYSRDDGLNYYNVYTSQIEDNLIETSPALVNQDMILKFQNPWETGFIDYSQKPPVQSTEVYKYLQRGTKTSQKDSFVYRRSTLLSSKYQADSFIKGSINFRTNVSVPDTELDKTSITITANQMIYPAVTYGDNKAPISSATKIAANTPYTFQATAEVGATDTIHIAGGAVLTDIGDLSKWSPYEVKVGLGANLKRLILGKKDAGYENLKLDRLDLTNCQLLETINVENCKALEELDVSKNGLIKEIYTYASNIKKVIIPNGGVLTTLQLGSKITEIKIQNQSYLTTFSYEGDDDVNITNPYASINTLWIENTPNVPVVDIITKNVINLTGGIRLNNINVNLGNDPTFLQILTSQELIKGKYINSNGEIDVNQYPYITGTVTISTIRRSLYNKLHTLYPQLTINVTTEIVDEYSIKYYNYGYIIGGTEEENAPWLLYTDSRIGDENYIDPVYDTNPITGLKYMSTPTKPEDAEWKYTFGTSNNNGYIRYSGWKKPGASTNPKATDKVSGDTVFVAQYPTMVKQTYTVTWYDTDNTVIYSLPNTPYGQDISYVAPETITLGNTGYFEKAKLINTTYKVFKGWNRPVGVITGTTNVYAQWEESHIDNATQGSGTGGAFTAQEIANLTAADLYALSQLGSEARARLLEDSLTELYPFKIPMGHDFNFTEGVTVTNLLGNEEELLFTGDTTNEVQIYNNITPLNTNSNWTLAIDYKFILDTAFKDGIADEYVLASCYKDINDNKQGFKLSVVRGSQSTDETQSIKLSWGTQSVVLDDVLVNPSSTTDKQYSQSFRNMLVLEHKANEPTLLYIYYSGHNGYTYGDTIGSTSLEWNNNTTINTPLIFGGNYRYSSEGTPIEIENTSYHAPANGIIYWAKYWNEDLGEINCQRLAQWTHEKAYFYLGGYNSVGTNNADRALIANTNLNFVAAQGIGDRYFRYNNTYDSTVYNGAGWINSDVRSFCNSRLYAGLPLAYQSIISLTSIESTTYNSGSGGATRTTTSDYIYLSGEKAVGNDTQDTNKIREAIHQWPWLVASDYHLLSQGSSSNTLVDGVANSINPWRIRFNGHPISANARIFNIAADPYRGGQPWNYNQGFIYVQSGDIWINLGESNGDIKAYMYFTNNEISEQGLYVDKITNDGGWVRADYWLLRTYNAASGSVNSYSLEKVDYSGMLYDTPGRQSPPADKGRMLCPEFSI